MMVLLPPQKNNGQFNFQCDLCARPIWPHSQKCSHRSGLPIRGVVVYGQQNTHMRRTQKEMAIKFYVLFVHSLSVKHPNEYECEISKCDWIVAVYIPNSVHYRFSYLSFASVFLDVGCISQYLCMCFFCVYVFFAIFSDWKWSEVQWVKCAKCAHARFVCCVVVCLLVEMSSRSLQCHFIRERSKFEMANKMMMSCLMMHSHAANVRTNKCAGARARIISHNSSSLYFCGPWLVYFYWQWIVKWWYSPRRRRQSCRLKSMQGLTQCKAWQMICTINRLWDVHEFVSLLKPE